MRARIADSNWAGRCVPGLIMWLRAGGAWLGILHIATCSVPKSAEFPVDPPSSEGIEAGTRIKAELAKARRTIDFEKIDPKEFVPRCKGFRCLQHGAERTRRDESFVCSNKRTKRSVVQNPAMVVGPVEVNLDVRRTPTEDIDLVVERQDATVSQKTFGNEPARGVSISPFVEPFAIRPRRPARRTVSQYPPIAHRRLGAEHRILVAAMPGL